MRSGTCRFPLHRSAADQSEFYQIASDGGFLEKPYVNKGLFISPGERAEIIVDFSKYEKGEVIQLQSGSEMIMTFLVGEKVEDKTEIPDTLVKIESINLSSNNRDYLLPTLL